MNSFVSSKPVSFSIPTKSRSRLLHTRCFAQSPPIESLVVSTVLSGALLWTPLSHADIIQTVSPSEVSSMGAPLKVEKVEKKKVWLVFIIGAISLFGFTNLIENNSSWFPAVTRANQAMSSRRKQQYQKIQEERSVESVEEGLEDARQQSLSSEELDNSNSQGMLNGQSSS
eukprot:g6886.t1